MTDPVSRDEESRDVGHRGLGTRDSHGEGMGDDEVRKKTLVNDSALPAGLEKVQRLLQLSADHFRTRVRLVTEVLGRVDDPSALGGESRHRGVQRDVEGRVDAEREAAALARHAVERDIEGGRANGHRPRGRVPEGGHVGQEGRDLGRAPGGHDGARVLLSAVGEHHAAYDPVDDDATDRHLRLDPHARRLSLRSQTVHDRLPAPVEIQDAGPCARWTCATAASAH